MKRLTAAISVKSQNEIIDRLALRADLSQIDPRAGERSTTNVVSVFFLFVIQGIKVGLDCKRDDGRWVVSKILLERTLVHCIFEHLGGFLS